ncbi:MAG: Asp-tRNA(Asn)/Glu-tRNA(Gln) amidotransferase subunit GatB [bacterium]
MNEKYIPTIGLEIHAELATKSKMFCACVNNPDEEKPNVNICPVCMGHPGTLPVLNHEAIKHVLKMGAAVGGTIADFTEWDRKNYFYPDIPKGYQISQYKYPLVSGGILAGVELTRIHLEEDTAQSTHDIDEGSAGRDITDKSLVNFNRAGVPLMELVTEPVIHDAATAVRFAKELQLLLRYLGAGEANLEKGEMRVEANISVASPADTAAGKFGTKTEVKNLNSFRAVERAIAYEIDRQVRAYEAGEKIVQETRGWSEATQKTFTQRAKESSHDYRYFPDPDIPKLKLSELPEFSATALKAELPELPWVLRTRLATEHEMTDKEVAVFVDNISVYNYFKETIKDFASDKKLVRLSINYILTDYLGLLKKEFGEGNYFNKLSELILPTTFSALIKLAASGQINSRGAKDILGILLANSLKGENGMTDANNPEKIATEKGLIQKNDEGELKKIAAEIIAANPTVVADYKAGKAAALQFFIGQAMKATKGSANPSILKDTFVSLL